MTLFTLKDKKLNDVPTIPFKLESEIQRTGGGRQRISQDIVERIMVLKQQGLSMRKIGQTVNIHHRTMAQYLDKGLQKK